MVDTPTPVRRTPLLGLLLVIPAFLLLCSGYVVPTARLFWTSLHDARFYKDDPEFIGLDNYGHLDRFYGVGAVAVIGIGLAAAAIAILIGGGVAYLAHRSGRTGRRLVWIGFALPLAALASTAVAISWLLAVAGESMRTYIEHPVAGNFFITLAASFGLLTGIGAVAYLLVLRAGRRVAVSGALVALVLGAASVAVAMQSLALPFMLRGPRDSAPPVYLIYSEAFQTARFGLAAAGGVVMLLVLAILGILVTAAVVFLQARLVRVEQTEPPSKPGPTIATAVVGGGVLLLGLLGLGPWLIRLADFGELPHNFAAAVFFTWAPPLVSTVVGVGAAALAGFGIGALRPLGSRSHLLLLPFAPWLFAGIAPFMVDAYAHLWRPDSGDNFVLAFLRAIPPSSLSIPALVLSAVLFRGLSTQDRPWRAWRTAAPVVALIALLTWVVQAQDVLWTLLVTKDEEYGSLQYWAFRQMSQFGYARSMDSLVGWLYPIPGWLLVAAAIAVVGVFVLDRLALRTGPEDEPPVA
ncbi:MAG: sugar ABC transporter permease [Hamadaea sp.]|uniref:hypothetical protein n=1 Tax=Hamadaea sp. TaxID=2024425 RepID=UPI00182FB333|nr:hypothetical protein [Hamadaea sp.]NUR72943.1 sugar ABC transporter permease [Hamadaea sp.]NUT23591.1 sugar ABC transporter permease [Hamadaea sp.]